MILANQFLCDDRSREPELIKITTCQETLRFRIFQLAKSQRQFNVHADDVNQDNVYVYV